MTFLSECLDGACIIIRTTQFCLDTVLSNVTANHSEHLSMRKQWTAWR
jgi:hypothetical protein